MKKVLFFVSILTMLLVTVSCKNPNTDSPEKEEEVITVKKSPEEPKTPEQPVVPENPEQPVVNPTVDLSVDYYYIGDMLFADSMDFDKWYLTNGNYPYSDFEGVIIKVEKIGRVHNPNKSTMMIRYSKTLTDVERHESNQDWFYVEYATKYKIWVNKEFMNSSNKNYWINDSLLLNTEICKDNQGNNIYDSNDKVDGTWIKLTYSQNESLEDVYNFTYSQSDKAQYYN